MRTCYQDTADLVKFTEEITNVKLYFFVLCNLSTQDHNHVYSIKIRKKNHVVPEAAVCRCSSKQLFFKISQYSQENTCVGVTYLIKLQAVNAKLLRTTFLQNTSGGYFCGLHVNLLCLFPPFIGQSKAGDEKRNEIYATG